jgi:hypothetical protein
VTDILAVITRLDFVFAKTMPEMPHEYTVRRKVRDDADYVALFEAIMRDGELEYWGKDGVLFYPARYLMPGDGWRYWSMSGWRNDAEGRQPLAVSRHINRSRLEEGEKLRAAGQLLREPPPDAIRYRRPGFRLPRLFARPGDPVRYAAAFTRTLTELLGPHGFELVPSPKPPLVVFAKNGTRVAITNPCQPGGSKIAAYTITRASGEPMTGAGRDALADALGLPRLVR